MIRLIIIACLAGVLIQFTSCASQTESRLNSDSVTKNKKQKEKESIGKRNSLGEIETPSEIETRSEIEEEVKEEVAEDDELPSPGNDKGISLVEEDKEMGTSVITYENVFMKAKKPTSAGATKKDEHAEMPVKGQKVKLRIQNKHNAAMWYLMPASGEKEMPSNGKFRPNLDAEQPFLAKKYGTDDNHLVELIYHGLDGQSFRAFYVEAGSSLLFRNYDLGTYREGDYVPFWSAKVLNINDNISLEDWLPFSVLSSPNIVIHSKTESGFVQWTDLGELAKYPEKQVKFVQAEGIKRYQIPVGLVR